MAKKKKVEEEESSSSEPDDTSTSDEDNYRGKGLVDEMDDAIIALRSVSFRSDSWPSIKYIILRQSEILTRIADILIEQDDS